MVIFNSYVKLPEGKWVSSPQFFVWINPTYPIYNWGELTHLLSGMSHQVPYKRPKFQGISQEKMAWKMVQYLHFWLAVEEPLWIWVRQLRVWNSQDMIIYGKKRLQTTSQILITWDRTLAVELGQWSLSLGKLPTVYLVIQILRFGGNT